MGIRRGVLGKGFWVKDKKEEIFSLSPFPFSPSPFLLPHAQCPMTAGATTFVTSATHCLPHAPCPMPHSPFPLVHSFFPRIQI
ncbi:MAG: hypothetical protein KME31_06930 [Tolypothrix carrinoi HA7290-LM1]|nr:hypothetical protein [Tolypothrix carrinoi HA7290-LM1]